MKDLYKEYFYVPKHGKVKEKVMLARISVSVVIMLALMAGMSLSAYAYFTANNTTAIKPIKTAHYQLDTAVIAPEGLTPQNGVYTLDNTEGNATKDFVFRISVNNETTTATVGFCEILVAVDDSREAPRPYYTEPIGKYVIADQEMNVLERSVKIPVPAGHKAEVSFVSQWGSCALPALVSVDNVAVIQPEFPPLDPDVQQDSNGNSESTGGDPAGDPLTPENDPPVNAEDSSDQGSDEGGNNE